MVVPAGRARAPTRPSRRSSVRTRRRRPRSSSAPGSAPTRRPRSTARRRSARSSRPNPARATASARTAPSRSRSPRAPTTSPFPEGVVGAEQADAEAALVAAGLEGHLRRRPSTATRCRTPRSSARPSRTAPPPSPAPRRSGAPRCGSRSPRVPSRSRSRPSSGRLSRTPPLSCEADNLKLAPTEVFSDTVAAGPDHRPEPRRGRRGPPWRHDRGQRLQGPGDARAAQHVRPERQDGRSRPPGCRVHREGRAPARASRRSTSSTRRSPRAARARRLPGAARSSSTSSDSAAAPPARADQGGSGRSVRTRGAAPRPGTPSPATAGGSAAGRPASRTVAPGPRRRSPRTRPAPR